MCTDPPSSDTPPDIAPEKFHPEMSKIFIGSQSIHKTLNITFCNFIESTLNRKRSLCTGKFSFSPS